MLRPYTNWEMFLPKHSQNCDIINEPDNYVVDERLKCYKGIYNRMNQGRIQDHFSQVEGPLWGVQLYSKDTLDVAMESHNARMIRKKTQEKRPKYEKVFGEGMVTSNMKSCETVNCRAKSKKGPMAEPDIFDLFNLPCATEHTYPIILE